MGNHDNPDLGVSDDNPEVCDRDSIKPIQWVSNARCVGMHRHRFEAGAPIVVARLYCSRELPVYLYWCNIMKLHGLYFDPKPQTLNPKP